ncbi:MAG: DUF1287 domain-containing protein [Acidobacteria bacterium]|nr:DUF1287 domain-containing protein [Acidobacteriota bacterium]
MSRAIAPLAVAFAVLSSSLHAQQPHDVSRIVIDAAMAQTRQVVTYDPTYTRIAYPGGDVPADRGVCTDVVIRAYRKAGIDLQKEVHEDMRRAFSKYPKIWGLSRPDTNIDHRRVPNLMTYFKRKGSALPVTRDPATWKPGDLVTWNLTSGVPHIGVVVDATSSDGKRHLVVHNIGAGPQLEDVLFAWTVTGHYRFP